MDAKSDRSSLVPEDHEEGPGDGLLQEDDRSVWQQH